MKEIKLTCPFTGVEFTALEDVNGNIYAKHALTGEDIKLNWNCTIQRYNLPKSALKHYETITPVQAAKMLDVSKQRISQIVQEQIIPVHVVNGSPVFILSDVEKYSKNRAVGRPKKVDTV